MPRCDPISGAPGLRSTRDSYDGIVDQILHQLLLAADPGRLAPAGEVTQFCQTKLAFLEAFTVSGSNGNTDRPGFAKARIIDHGRQ